MSKNKLQRYFENLYKDIKEIGSIRIRGFIKKRIKLILVLCVVLSLGIGYFIGSLGNSKDQILISLEVALKNEDANKLKKIVKLEDKKLSAEDLKPLIEYYKENSLRIVEDIKRLKQGQETEIFYIVEENNMIFSEIYIKLKTYDIKVNSNFDSGKFVINDSYETIYSKESFENVIPGKYLIKGILDSKYNNIETVKEINILESKEVEIDFNAINITVESPYQDAEVYINDVDSNLKVEEAKEIGPFNLEETNYIYIKRNFPWGEVQGEKVYIRDIPIVKANINFENNEMKNDILELAKEFYNSVFDALNMEDKSYITGATNGTKEKVYNILEKSYILLKNKYIIDEIEVVEDKSEYSYKDQVYRATIIVKVDYSIEKKLFGLNETKNSKLFFTNIIYENDEWVVEDVENFSLE